MIPTETYTKNMCLKIDYRDGSIILTDLNGLNTTTRLPVPILGACRRERDPINMVATYLGVPNGYDVLIAVTGEVCSGCEAVDSCSYGKNGQVLSN